MSIETKTVDIPEAGLKFAFINTHLDGNFIEVWSDGMCKYQFEIPSDIGGIKADGVMNSVDGKTYDFSVEYYDKSLQAIRVYHSDNYPKVLWAWYNN